MRIAHTSRRSGRRWFSGKRGLIDQHAPAASRERRIVAANELGLTNAVPAKIVIWTDGRLKPIRLGNRVLEFRPTAPSRLYWAGRPSARIIQAMRWLGPKIVTGDRDRVVAKLAHALKRTGDARRIRHDLQVGLRMTPSWMRGPVQDLIAQLRAAPKVADTPIGRPKPLGSI